MRLGDGAETGSVGREEAPTVTRVPARRGFGVSFSNGDGAATAWRAVPARLEVIGGIVRMPARQSSWFERGPHGAP